MKIKDNNFLNKKKKNFFQNFIFSLKFHLLINSVQGKIFFVL
jgi:hypothetical protein